MTTDVRFELEVLLNEAINKGDEFAASLLLTRIKEMGFHVTTENGLLIQFEQ